MQKKIAYVLKVDILPSYVRMTYSSVKVELLRLCSSFSI